MPFVQEIDRKRIQNSGRHTLYSGSGFATKTKIPRAYYQTTNTNTTFITPTITVGTTLSTNPAINNTKVDLLTYHL
jgi:hypothetical protein